MATNRIFFAVLSAVFFLASCGTASKTRKPSSGKRPAAVSVSKSKAIETGVASWYGPDFHGNKTANGEVYDMNSLTAAHRTLPFGSVVLVENLDNGKSVQVRINDRGPFAKNRIIDLSRKAAGDIDMIGPGTARVRLYLVGSDLKDSKVTDIKQANYTIQVGSFSEISRANEVASQLKDSRVERVQVNGETLYRVYYGTYRDPEDARKALNKMDRRWNSAFVKQVEN